MISGIYLPLPEAAVHRRSTEKLLSKFSSQKNTVNVVKYLRTVFLYNTSIWLLLFKISPFTNTPSNRKFHEMCLHSAMIVWHLSWSLTTLIQTKAYGQLITNSIHLYSNKQTTYVVIINGDIFQSLVQFNI